MTYGAYLEETAAALARAHEALRGSPPGTVDDHMAAAIARTQLYRALARQVELIAGGGAGRLARELNQATASSPRDLPAPPASSSPIAVALREAVVAAQTAGDILASHVGPAPADSVGVAAQARTPEGVAVLAGVDRPGNLAHLARLADTAAAIDRRFGVWLDQNSIINAAATDAGRTSAGSLSAVSTKLVAAAHPERAFVTALTTAPAVEDPDRWRDVASAAECVAAVDAGRAWLLQNQDQLTAGQLGAVTRTGLALSHEIGYLVQATSPAANATHAIEALTRRWRAAATALDKLKSPSEPLPATGVVALDAAERWLRDQLRPDGQWRAPAELVSTPESAQAWQSTTQELLSRLPDLGALVHRSTTAAVQRGHLLQHMRQPQWTTGRLVVTTVGRWEPARDHAAPAGELLAATGQLRENGQWLARMAEVDLRPGIHEAATYPHGRSRPVQGSRAIEAVNPVQADQLVTAVRGLTASIVELRDEIQQQSGSPVEPGLRGDPELGRDMVAAPSGAELDLG